MEQKLLSSYNSSEFFCDFSQLLMFSEKRKFEKPCKCATFAIVITAISNKNYSKLDDTLHKKCCWRLFKNAIACGEIHAWNVCLGQLSQHSTFLLRLIFVVTIMHFSFNAKWKQNHSIHLWWLSKRFKFSEFCQFRVCMIIWAFFKIINQFAWNWFNFFVCYCFTPSSA